MCIANYYREEIEESWADENPLVRDLHLWSAECDLNQDGLPDYIIEWHSFGYTIIMMTADHGGIKKGHGGITLQEVEIPFIIAGKNVRKGGEFQESMMQFDTAATMGYVFGVKQPQVWIGRPMIQVFK